MDGLAWRACSPAYAARVGPHEYVVRHQTCPEEAWAALQGAIHRYGRREQYLVTGHTFDYLLLGEHRYWTAPGWEVINRARQADVTGKHGSPASTEERPGPADLNLEFRGGQVANTDTGEEYDIAAVAARIPWVTAQTGRGSWDAPPYMPPHQYVVFGRCDPVDWEVLAFAIAKHPDSYRAYFRGYQSPTRYWEPGDRYRYWRTAWHGTQMLNRCMLDSVEPPRRVDQGAQPIKPQDWGAPPWLPQGSGWPQGRQPGPE